MVLFFTIAFAVLFLAMTGMRFMALRLEWVRSLSGQTDFIVAARWALSLALYGGILLGLIYAVVERLFAPAAIVCIILLSVGFTAGIGQWLENLSNVPAGTPADRPQTLGGPGLILSNPVSPMRPNGIAIVLLQGPGEPARARVVADPGSPMLFQPEFAGLDHSLVNLPPAPFNSDTPWFLQNLAIDLRLSAENLQNRLGEGMAPFLLYLGSLVFLLSSLMFILKLGTWPLANFFLGLLAFRGVLALETLFITYQIQEVFAPFLQGRLSVSFVAPVIFLIAGLFAHLYSLLAHLARRQASHATV